MASIISVHTLLTTPSMNDDNTSRRYLGLFINISIWCLLILITLSILTASYSIFLSYMMIDYTFLPSRHIPRLVYYTKSTSLYGISAYIIVTIPLISTPISSPVIATIHQCPPLPAYNIHALSYATFSMSL